MEAQREVNLCYSSDQWTPNESRITQLNGTIPDIQGPVTQSETDATRMHGWIQLEWGKGDCNERMETSKILHGNQHVVTYSLKIRIQKFGKSGRQSALKEMKQLHDRMFWASSKGNTYRNREETALESLIFLSEKKDGTIKLYHGANGWLERKYPVLHWVPILHFDSNYWGRRRKRCWYMWYSKCIHSDPGCRERWRWKSEEYLLILLTYLIQSTEFMWSVRMIKRCLMCTSWRQSMVYLCLHYWKFTADLTTYSFDQSLHDEQASWRKSDDFSLHVDDLKVSKRASSKMVD